MKIKLLVVCVLMALIFSSGFTSSDKLTIDSIIKRVDKLESDYSALSSMEVQNSIDIFSLKNMYSTAYFSAYEVGTDFYRLDHDLGMFFIMLKSVTKIGNSYNLNFLVGNPQYATYNGCDFTLKYNVELGDKSIINWRKTEKTINQKMQNTVLKPGSWNPITINVPTSNLSEIAYIEIQMSLNRVTLADASTTSSENVIIGDDTSNVIESKIDGDFEGIGYENVYKLTNGQIWQQTSADYQYHYAYSPEVTIYKSGTVYKMVIEGVDKKITVKQLK